MSRKSFLDEFYDDVLEAAVRQGMSRDHAGVAVGDVRNDLAAFDISELIAHWELEEIARAIVAQNKFGTGFPLAANPFR
jgi:hypothetical protein